MALWPSGLGYSIRPLSAQFFFFSMQRAMGSNLNGRDAYTPPGLSLGRHGTYFIEVVLLLPPEQPLKREGTSLRSVHDAYSRFLANTLLIDGLNKLLLLSLLKLDSNGFGALIV